MKILAITEHIGHRYVTVLSLIFLSTQILAQKNPQFNTLTQKLETYVDSFAPEKVYLQTDKDFYRNGDTIWFKTYLVNGITHMSSDKSNIVYVELLDPKGSLVVKRKLYTDKVGIHGDIKIEDSLEEGDYRIRAYTNYMLNDRDLVVFEKEISILARSIATNDKSNNAVLENTKREKDQKSTVTSSQMSRPNVQFFPEGGNLVLGLQSMIGLKIIDESGNGIALKGNIIDQNGTLIDQFETYDFGLGTVTITPKRDTDYYAEIDIDGKLRKYPIPTAIGNGYAVQLKNRGFRITLKVTTNIHQGLKGTLLLGHLRGEVFTEYPINSVKDSYTISFDTSKLFDGVAQFTLFDRQGEPICERLTFIDNPYNETDLSIKTDKSGYGLREKVAVAMSFFDAQGKPLQGDFSVSVALDNSIKKGSSNIKSWLLLNSDLGNTVENPSYFFAGDSIAHKNLLDASMLAHKWRRFVWKSFLTGDLNRIPEFPPEKGIMINGRTTAYQPKRTLTTLSILGQDTYQEKKLTDAQGKFSFGPLVFQDSVKAFIKASSPSLNRNNNEKFAVYLDSTETKINIDDPTGQKSHNTILVQEELKQKYRDKVSDFTYATGVTALSEVVVQAKKKTRKEQFEEELNMMTMYGAAQNRLFPDSIPGLGMATVFDLLSREVGVQVMGTSPHQSVRIRGINSLSSSGDPLFTLDGVPVSADFIQGMTVNNVLFVDVLKGNEAGIYGARGTNGVVAVYTDRGLSFEARQEIQPGITNFVVQGFYKAREFYSPNYGVDKTEHTIPDYRTTLYWNPDIMINGKSGTKLNFYTGDIAGKYTVRVEGITNDGRPVSKQCSFEVFD